MAVRGRDPRWSDMSELFFSHNVAMGVDADLLNNAYIFRRDMLAKMSDPRTDIGKECGFPEHITPKQYQQMFDRNPIAARAVEVFPRECFEAMFEVVEDEDADSDTEFEEAFKNLGKNLAGGKSWNKQSSAQIVGDYLRRLDEQSGIGSFGLLLFGFSGDEPLWQPLQMKEPALNQLVTNELPKKWPEYKGEYPRGTDEQYYDVGQSAPQQSTSPGSRELLYLRVFPESMVQVVEYDSNLNSPRFGQPIRYLITLNDQDNVHGGIGLPISSVYVHWTRVLHVSDNWHQGGANESFNPPRLKCIYDNLYSLAKVYGASGEGYWRMPFPWLSIETNPQLGGQVQVNKSDLRNMMEQVRTGLQKEIYLSGMSAKTVGGSVTDPRVHVDIQIEAICIKLGIPKRVFMGSERGEQASTQDDEAWNDRKRARQNGYITTRIIVPFIDRLIAVGVLPEPETYHVVWPDVEALNAQAKATVASTLTTAISTWVTGGLEQVLPFKQFLVHILDMDPEVADAIIDAAEDNEPMLEPPGPGGADDPAALDGQADPEGDEPPEGEPAEPADE